MPRIKREFMTPDTHHLASIIAAPGQSCFNLISILSHLPAFFCVCVLSDCFPWTNSRAQESRKKRQSSDEASTLGQTARVQTLNCQAHSPLQWGQWKCLCVRWCTFLYGGPNHLGVKSATVE